MKTCLLVLMAGLLLITACAPRSSGLTILSPTPPGIITGETTATSDPTHLITPSPAVSVGSKTPTPSTITGDASSSFSPNEGIGNVITYDNNNQRANYRVGETFLLKLGADYDWKIQMDPAGIISRVVNVLVIKGGQGIYRAVKPGTLILTAVGEPLCRNQKPACMQPSLSFMIHIVVTE